MHGSRSGAHDRASMPTASVRMPRLTSSGTRDERMLAEECPVALVYDGTTVAVVMATPADLTDLAVGFSLTEGIIGDIGEIEELTVVPGRDGIELRLWLRTNAGRRLKERRRHLVGPTGCGPVRHRQLAGSRADRSVRRAASEPHGGADQHGRRNPQRVTDPQPQDTRRSRRGFFRASRQDHDGARGRGAPQRPRQACRRSRDGRSIRPRWRRHSHQPDFGRDGAKNRRDRRRRRRCHVCTDRARSPNGRSQRDHACRHSAGRRIRDLQPSGEGV
jgi:FdhD/NarQ family